MHRHFKGNWLLAIASYNTGAGNVGKAIDRANNLFTKPSYWDLNLPRETELYVPRLLALSKIIANPERYGFSLPDIKNKKYTLEDIYAFSKPNVYDIYLSEDAQHRITKSRKLVVTVYGD